MLLGELFPAHRQMQEGVFAGGIGNLLRVFHTLNGALVVIHHSAASGKYYRQPRVVNAKGAESFRVHMYLPNAPRAYVPSFL